MSDEQRPASASDAQRSEEAEPGEPDEAGGAREAAEPDEVAELDDAGARQGAAARPEYRFDHHDPDFGRDPWSTYAEMRERCPVAWSDAYEGGFWVLSRYEDVFAVARDDETFSSDREVVLPATDVGRIIPLNSDPPDLKRYRRLLNPWFTLGAAETLEPRIREFATALIDGFIESGQCDLVRDLANPLPAMTTMALMGLPVDDWPVYAEPIHQSFYHRSGTPERAAAMAELMGLRPRMRDELEARRGSAGDDLMDRLAAAQADGTIDAQEAEDLAVMVLIGGIDTTMAALSTAFLRISRDETVRQRLLDDAELLPSAVDEFLRIDPPVQGFARTVTADVEVGGQAMAGGDTLFMLWGSANRDEAVFPDADQLVLDRHPNRHLTFGIGGHRCLGATLARTEMKVVLSEVLRRMPDFHVDEAGLGHPETIGIVYGLTAEPATFSPGPRLG